MTSMTMDNAKVRARARLARLLAADLDRILHGIGPTADDLAAAPIMEDWILAPYAGIALKGSVPHLVPGELTSTEVFVLDPGAGYARTFSRLYRLGRPGHHLPDKGSP